MILNLEKEHIMHTISCRNVNHAYPMALRDLHRFGKHRNSRVGPTLEIPMPVCTTYLAPWERVLFDPFRDANPFFHLFEALWILRGRQDVAFLKYLLPSMEAYSDKGKVFHGAYGHRLRHGFDQLQAAIDMFQMDPESRRVVLSIWNPTKDLGANSKDIPCNDMIMLKMRMNSADKPSLDMTVLNRSNDAIWGCYGANVVQFSVIQEYIASRLRIQMGLYNQVSDSFHVYTNNEVWKRAMFIMKSNEERLLPLYDYYAADNTMSKPVVSTPLFDDPDHIDADLGNMFMDFDIHKELFHSKYSSFYNSIFNGLLRPMAEALKLHRHGYSVEARDHLMSIKGYEDWKLACIEWLSRRIMKKGGCDAK